MDWWVSSLGGSCFSHWTGKKNERIGKADDSGSLEPQDTQPGDSKTKESDATLCFRAVSFLFPQSSPNSTN